jgi:cobalt-zinc-cadmium efflux system protein
VVQNHSRDLEGQKGSLLLSIGLNFVFAVIELGAGLVANSLALLSSSIHDFSDAGALALSYLALRLAQRKPSGKRTFGFRKVRILVAFVNALILIGLTVLVLRSAVGRLAHPQPVRSPILIVVAIGALLVNGAAVLSLRRHRKSLSLRAAMWHLLDDALGGLAVLAGGVIIRLTGWNVVDPILSILLGVYLIYGAWTVFRDAFRVLIDSTPADIAFDQVSDFIRGFDPSIQGIHDLHIWSIGEGEVALMTHIVVHDGAVGSFRPLLSRLECALHDKFDITHVTLELECEECKSGDNVCMPEAGR